MIKLNFHYLLNQQSCNFGLWSCKIKHKLSKVMDNQSLDGRFQSKTEAVAILSSLSQNWGLDCAWLLPTCSREDKKPSFPCIFEQWPGKNWSPCAPESAKAAPPQQRRLGVRRREKWGWLSIQEAIRCTLWSSGCISSVGGELRGQRCLTEAEFLMGSSLARTAQCCPNTGQYL